MPVSHLRTASVSARPWRPDAFIVAAFALVAYANTLGVPFYFDDANFITRNPFIRDLRNFIPPFSSDLLPGPLRELMFSRFVGFLSFALNYRIHGLSVGGYHAVNLLIHIGCSLVLHAFVRTLYRAPEVAVEEGRARFTAFAAALVFAAHPAQTQAVTYIGQRFASLVALFYLASLLMYLHARLAPTRWRAWAYLALSFAAGLLAMRTKENAFTLPFTAMALEFLIFTGPVGRRAVRLLPLLLLLVVIPLGMVSTTGAFLEGSVHTKVYSAHDYLATQARIHLTYARLVLFPVNLTLDYGYPVKRSFAALPVIVSAGAICAIFATTVYLMVLARRERRTYAVPAFGMVYYILAHSVESSFVSIVELIAEHRIYLPLPGLLLAVVALVAGAALGGAGRARAMRALWASALALGLVLTGATVARNELWGDPLAFWEDAVRKSPDNWRALTYLGQAYRERAMPGKAAEALERAADLLPPARIGTASTYVSLGQAYAELGEREKALAAFDKAIEIFPAYDTLIEAAHVRIDLGLYEEAVATASRAVEAMPENPEAYAVLGLTASYAGRYEEAFAAFDRALALDPELDSARYNRALASLEAGDRAGAEREYEVLRARGSSFATPLESALRK